MSDPEVERLFNERDCRHSDREGGTCCTTCAKDIAASLRARLLTLEQALETMPRYMEHDVWRRSSMAKYVSLDDVEAALAASRGA